MFAFHIEKFIHLLCATSFLGVNLMNYALVAKALKVKDRNRLRFTLKSSLIADLLMPVILVILFLTGTSLVRATPYTFHTPWVQAAYTLLTASLFCWLANAIIKVRNFQRLSQHKEASFLYRKSYHAMNLMMILLLIALAHDAIVRHTFF